MRVAPVALALLLEFTDTHEALSRYQQFKEDLIAPLPIDQDFQWPDTLIQVWLADRPVLCLAMGTLALIMDLGFTLVLFSRRARRVLVPAAVLFHAAILVTQNYAFLSAPLLLVFVDWGPRVSRGRTPPGGGPSTTPA